MNSPHTAPTLSVLILGSGPAGCTAALYAARARLTPIVIAGAEPGGQLTVTTEVENYPGFIQSIMGPDLMERMCQQAKAYGARFEEDIVTNVDLTCRPFSIRLDSGRIYRCHSLIIATGARARWLGLESETRFRGRGVSACAVCDGFFFREKKVGVIGGGNTAVEEALFLARLASQVYLIHRRSELRAEKILQERLSTEGKIKPIWNHIVTEILGDHGNPPSVSAVRLRHLDTDIEHDLPLDGVFIAIGHEPATHLFRGMIPMDNNGYLRTINNQVTTIIPGVFAAGDVADSTYRQAVTAAGMGCMAAMEAERFLATRST